MNVILFFYLSSKIIFIDLENKDRINLTYKFFSICCGWKFKIYICFNNEL